MANVQSKRRITYRMPVMQKGSRIWHQFSDIDTSSDGAFAYDHVLSAGEDAFAVIASGALEAGCGRSGSAGMSTSHVFEAGALVLFAILWLEQHFGIENAQSSR